MVRIIDGEIVADGDPRLAQQRPEVPGQPAAASPAGPAAGGTGGHAFSLSAPPLRVLQDAGGTKVVIFGFPIDATHLAMLVAAGVFMGSRGLLFAGVLYFVYLSNRAAGPQQQWRSDPAGAAAAYIRDQQRPPSRAGGPQPGAAAPAARPAADKWAGKGRAYTLSGS